MGPKTFSKIVDHIFPIRASLIKISDNVYYRERLYFDYPHYAGLPKRVVNSLSPEAVDAMQHILHERFTRKRDFARAYKKRLMDLGEKLS